MDLHPPAALDGEIRIGDCLLDCRRNELVIGPDRKALEPRLVRLLATLAAAGGTPVSRDTLLAAVSALPFAGDEALTQAISKLRLALQDDPKAPRYIKTIPRRGYALIAPVEANEVAVPAAVPGVAVSDRSQRPLFLVLGLVILILSGLVARFVIYPYERVTEIILDDGPPPETEADQEFIEKKD